jgi:hypothetical protein
VNAYAICQASNIDPKIFRINIAIMFPVEPHVKRNYDPSKRREAAARTREAVLNAALFRDRGYAATPMTAIAH